MIKMYTPCDSPIDLVGGTTIIKQKWLLLQEQKRDIHPHKTAIIDTMDAINKKQKEGHEVFISLDRNERFILRCFNLILLCTCLGLIMLVSIKLIHLLMSLKFAIKSAN